MTSRPLPLALALAVALAAAGCAGDAPVPAAGADADTAAPVAAHGQPDAHAHDDAHAAADANVDVPVPEGHEPWTPDAPLIEGMSRVRGAVSALEAAPAPSAAADQRAGIDEAIGYIFANCRLDPEPDAALHGVLARLMAASQALQADPDDAAAVASMRAAVSNYEALFDDPNS